MKSLSGFVFDLDGTLVDSKIDFVSMKRELGLDEQQDVLRYIESLNSRDRAAAMEVVARHEEAGARGAVTICGALEFCERLRRAHFPIAILTRNAKSIAQVCLDVHGFKVDLVVAREDCAPKPLPDGLHLIAKEFELNLSELYFVGDYLYDLQAGLSAGVRTALYLTGPADFDTAGADFLFDDYLQLSRHLGI